MERKRKRIKADEEAVIVEALRKGYPSATAADLSGVSMELLNRTLEGNGAQGRRLRRARGEGQTFWIAQLVRCAEEGKVSAATDALKIFYPGIRTPGTGQQNEGAAQLNVAFDGVTVGRL